MTVRGDLGEPMMGDKVRQVQSGPVHSPGFAGGMLYPQRHHHRVIYHPGMPTGHKENYSIKLCYMAIQMINVE